MTLSKLARIALGIPVVGLVAASLAWQIARMHRDDREALAAAIWDVFFAGDEVTQRGGK